MITVGVQWKMWLQKYSDGIAAFHMRYRKDIIETADR